MNGIVGHQAIRSRLGSQIRAGNFPQTSLFYGISGCGKKLVALEVAQTLLCENPAVQEELYLYCGNCRSCQSFKAGNHPDFHFIAESVAQSRAGKNSASDDDEAVSAAAAKKSGTIKTEQVVELKKRIAYPPLMGKYHVTVFDNADLMTETTANSLLKLLEEPRREQVFILVSGRLHRLLITIRSRCAKFHFTSLSSDQSQQIVLSAFDADEMFDPELFKFYQNCFPGSPVMIREAMQLPLKPQDYEKIISRREGFIASREIAQLVLESGSDPALFLKILRGYCLSKAVVTGTASGRDADFIDRIAAAERRLERHIPAEFVLENLFL